MEIKEAVNTAFSEDAYKCVISNARDTISKYHKITINKAGADYYIEKLSATQAFHETMSYVKAKRYVLIQMEGGYRDLHSWSKSSEYAVKVSKRGKVSLSVRKASAEAPKTRESHNRQKDYIIKQGEDIPPLIDLGVFTKDGKVKSAMYDKYKQINRFVEIIDDVIANEAGRSNNRPLRILDFGCGKSYLTFILYHYFTKIRGLDVCMTGLDLRADVIEKCRTAALKYGYSKLDFKVGDIAGYDYKDEVDVIITLHACDTATDYAIYNAIMWNTGMIFSVPCCQHEVNAQIKGGDFSLLTRYGLVKERFSSLVTDAIRANLLECCGYRTQMLELVPFDHTPKNIMLRAVKRGAKDTAKERREVERIVSAFGLTPTLYRLLAESGRLPDLHTEERR